ncbi:MAG: hypothetical protein KatS3mg118_3440 [Paracoccaceae bacterium]|nr:MAG: hypothetical protein D6686_10295 [Alphaproteobacteria bacterium]GIX15481.1 MAG: hypothetical protein KatS3mg118_3440 [Paracoccaceae bacterium]
MLDRLLAPGSGFQRRIAALVALLETERGLIRRGAIAELAALDARRQKLLAALAEADPPPGPESAAALEALRQAAERNLRLLQSFRDGLARAGERARRMARDSAAIGLYGPGGERRGELSAPPARDRRA